MRLSRQCATCLRMENATTAFTVNCGKDFTHNDLWLYRQSKSRVPCRSARGVILTWSLQRESSSPRTIEPHFRERRPASSVVGEHDRPPLAVIVDLPSDGQLHREENGWKRNELTIRSLTLHTFSTCAWTLRNFSNREIISRLPSCGYVRVGRS